MKKKNLLILALFGVLLVAAIPLAPDIVIDWWAIGPGSSRLSNAGSELHGMVGQGITGQGSVARTDLCAGYLCVSQAVLVTTHLPLIMK